MYACPVSPGKEQETDLKDNITEMTQDSLNLFTAAINIRKESDIAALPYMLSGWNETMRQR